ncbi:uncharacterized protein AC631_03505 [Debaryomyces fabryi]|uniref:Pre-rRNA-processing protein TSR2 n=1 Tax=Debaryomyces fabryi TaxID=58627 RepID=A0A0V1PXN8_9ASCO|nr:uncharacterized protein AC631_03505 [Debaryomyces fabryi]KSA00735.1 hypothetical protein AC631_03505 [Debaryomyces fabryi]CUM47120.1 unnamed protein product [Debaryomyces fabryi]
MTLIDPTDFIEAEEGVNSLRFEDEKQQAKFELGVCMCVYKWDELNTAVTNSWGGPNSADKRDWISGIVIDLFNERIVDVQLIEETLLYAMVDEFDTEVDNESALVIADMIVKMYREVYIKKYDVIDELYLKWQQKQLSGQGQQEKVVINEDPNNPDVSDSEDEDEDEQPALVQPNDSMDLDEPQAPIVDDDGFELVQKKGRKGGRR